MKKALVIVGIWLSLFACTFIVRRLVSNKARAAPSPQALKAADVAEELKKLPRVSRVPLVEFDSELMMTRYSEFSNAFDSGVRAMIDSLRRCKVPVMARSARIKEYLEVSFEIVIAPHVGSGDEAKRYMPTNVLVERSTALLTVADVTCILDVVESVRFEASAIPVGRIASPLCFGSNDL